MWACPFCARSVRFWNRKTHLRTSCRMSGEGVAKHYQRASGEKLPTADTSHAGGSCAASTNLGWQGSRPTGKETLVADSEYERSRLTLEERIAVRITSQTTFGKLPCNGAIESAVHFCDNGCLTAAQFFLICNCVDFP